MKVDVWSLGATVWELIEGETPFENDPSGPYDRLPELTNVQEVSQGLLGFLHLCEMPPTRRPSARELLQVRDFTLSFVVANCRILDSLYSCELLSSRRCTGAFSCQNSGRNSQFWLKSRISLFKGPLCCVTITAAFFTHSIINYLRNDKLNADSSYLSHMVNNKAEILHFNPGGYLKWASGS
jgi:serine/threonine protein kinase